MSDCPCGKGNQHSIRQSGQCDRQKYGKSTGTRHGGTQYSDKDRMYRNFCRSQVKAGYINDASGNWVKYDAGKAMHADQRAGYKL